MTVAEYKHKWILDRRAELNARGLRDAAIARQMGYKPPYFAQVVKGDAPPGDGFIDKMCAAFGLSFPPKSLGNDAMPTPEGMTLVPKEEWEDLVRQAKTNNRLMSLLMDQMERRFPELKDKE